MAKKSAAVDRLRADLIAQHEAKRLACEEAKEQLPILERLEAAWENLQVAGDAKAVITLAELLTMADLQTRLQHVQDRAIAFCEAIDNEPDADWRYPGLSASKAKAIEHAATMRALTSILCDAIEGRKAATIGKAMKALRSWERVGWESLRGELLFCDQLPTEPSRVESVRTEVEQVSKSEPEGDVSEADKPEVDLKKLAFEWFIEVGGTYAAKLFYDVLGRTIADRTIKRYGEGYARANGLEHKWQEAVEAHAKRGPKKSQYRALLDLAKANHNSAK